MPDDAKRILTPRLRFPEFRKGKGWEEKPLKAICEINPPNGDLPESFIYIDLEAVEGGVLNARKRVDKTDAPSRAQRLLVNGDVVFQIVRPYQRNNLFVKFDDNETYVASTGYAQLRAHESTSFLYQVVHTDPFVDKVIAKCTGSSYPAINSSDLAEVMLPVPPSAREQQKIADCLTSLDDCVAAQGRKVEALKAHKKGLMQQLFPREGETLPRLRFAQFERHKDWRYENVIDFAKVTTGDKDTQDKVDDGEFPFFVRSQTSQRINSYAMDTEAVLTSGDGVGVGDDYHYVNGKFDFHQRVYCIYDFRNDVWGRFFYVYFCEHFRARVGKMSAKNSVDSVRRSMIAEMPVALPEFDEQKAISDGLLALDDQIIAEAKKLAALKTHKRGLMQHLFPSPEGD